MLVKDLSAIVLAGGQSTRMGRDKALISIDGVPLLSRTCAIAAQCAGTVVVVTPRVDAYQSQVPPNCQFVEERPLPGSSLPHGPLVGFAQGLAQLQSVAYPDEWVLLLACDLPHLQADILQRWGRQLAESNATALLPIGKKGWEPLCGFYHACCLPQLNTFIHQDGRSFQRWLGGEAVQAIAFSCDPEERQAEHAMLFNCNTPEDFGQAMGHRQF